MISVGIDAGAATTKVVLLIDREIADYCVSSTAFDFLTAAKYLFSELIAASHIDENQVEKMYATDMVEIQ
ncbi:MAG: hypothetical protein LUQ38_04390 [Methanotrichaceae archaeon]|nr:hypothetical protein [Methanotrichaceae archaeon]